MMQIRKRKSELEDRALELQIEHGKIKMKKDNLEIQRLQRDLGLVEATDAEDDL